MSLEYAPRQNIRYITPALGGIVHATYASKYISAYKTTSGYMWVRRVRCADGVGAVLMAGTFESTDDMVTCAVCVGLPSLC
jgi:hypothetical protein